MRIYLDVCCLNRPLDDLSIGRNRLEAEAVLEIIRRVHGGEWELIGSEAIEMELSLMPSVDRRAKIASLVAARTAVVLADQPQRERALKLVSLGFTYMDALHIACAESAACDVMLTTDDAILRRSRTHSRDIIVAIANPLQWIAEVSA